ncbi:MAG TPA: M14 family metallopeptidase [Acidimicrobiia bacterium]
MAGTAIAFDHLYTYDELTGALRALADAHPTLMTLESVGTSYEGRDLWLATITNQATGPHHEKPAVWVDANIHSVEHTGCVAALYLVHKLVTTHGADEQVTRAVDTRTFYVMPRVNPDGAELALATPPTYLRSSVRTWPRVDEAPGLVGGDVDGDGRVLTMRVPDPNGAWKISADDARLMVARAPDEHGAGPYFRLLYEGTIRDYDGATIPIAPERRSLDLNRQFPAGWRVHGEQQGAGAFPLSEPETRALADALVARPNVCCYFAHHTFSAALLRPYDDRPDDEMPTADLRRYKQLGARGTELTGYRHVSVYHDFRYDPKDVITGGADTWAYDHLGAYGWTTEFWSPIPRAGITEYHLVEWFDAHPIADDIALLRYSDTELGGRGFVDWYPFEHPQLGTIELGGWDSFRFWENPPDELLEREVAPHADWEIFCALATPSLRTRDVLVESIGADVWRVRLVVENDGWMPTNVTQRAVERKIAQPVLATIELPDDASLVRGAAVVELGQLEGRSFVTTMVGDFGSHSDTTPDRAVAEWLVTAQRGTTVTCVAAHARSGMVREAVTLQ